MTLRIYQTTTTVAEDLQVGLTGAFASQPGWAGPDDFWLASGYSSIPLSPTNYALISVKYDGMTWTVGDLVGTDGSIFSPQHEWLRGGQSRVTQSFYGNTNPTPPGPESRTGQKTVYTMLSDGSIRSVVVNLPDLPSTLRDGGPNYSWQWLKSVTTFTGDIFVCYAQEQMAGEPWNYLAHSYQVLSNGDVRFLGTISGSLYETGEGGYWVSDFPAMDHNDNICHVADNVILGPSFFGAGSAGNYYRTAALDLTAPLSPWITSNQLCHSDTGTGIGLPSGNFLGSAVPTNDWDGIPGFWANDAVGTIRRYSWNGESAYATSDTLGPYNVPQLGQLGFTQRNRDGTLVAHGANPEFTVQEVYWNIGEANEFSYKSSEYDLQSCIKIGDDVAFFGSTSFEPGDVLPYLKPSNLGEISGSQDLSRSSFW